MKSNVITVITKKEAEILGLNRRILDESPDLVAVVGTDFLFYYVNPSYARVHGLRPFDIKGKHCTDFLGEDIFKDVVRPRLEKCLAGEDVNYQEWYRFPKTDPVYMDVRYMPLTGTQKGVQRIAIILRDITYLRMAEEERLEREKLQTVIELAGTYNHEINNPLCSLGGYVELLKIGESDPKKLELIEKAGQDLRRIADVTKKIGEATSIRKVDYPGGDSILDVSHVNERQEAGMK